MGKRKYSEDLIKKCQELYEAGFIYSDISSGLNIPLSTLSYHLNPKAKERKREYYQRPEVKEHQREYQRRRRKRIDPAFQEFLDLTENPKIGLNEIENVYVLILEKLSKYSRFGLKYKSLKRSIENRNDLTNLTKKELKITPYQLMRLRKKRYSKL